MNKNNIVVLKGIGIRVPVEEIGGNEPTLTNFVEQLVPLSNELYVILRDSPAKFPDKVHLIKIKCVGKRDWILISIFRFLLTQLKICFNLYKISRDIDIVILYTGVKPFVLPILCSKLFRKKTVICSTGVITKRGLAELGLLSYYIFKVLEEINFLLVDRIAVESPIAIDLMGLNRFRKKIIVTSAMYIDTNIFKITKDISKRKNLVGYIGRLAEGKGIENFIQAIPLILEKRDDLEFLIGGDGSLFNKIKDKLEMANLTEKVKLTGWIPHDELSKYLNELKLFILPSYMEGLPCTLQEAMACGAIVLATPVGGIPDVIKDGKTGFILENNSPECIAKNVIMALEHPNLDEIVKNAQKLIEEEYAYEPLVKKLNDSLDELIEKSLSS
ncbi:MAG: glycosyltransferase family 4 protein [Candidatus Methanoperedens sp.]